MHTNKSVRLYDRNKEYFSIRKYEKGFGTLHEIEKMGTRPYITTVDNYDHMLGRAAIFSYNI